VARGGAARTHRLILNRSKSTACESRELQDPFQNRGECRGRGGPSSMAGRLFVPIGRIDFAAAAAGASKR
jgi:hypothetical protein